MTGRERRRFKRVKFRVKASVRGRDFQATNLRTRDISVKGAFIECEKKPPLGALCELKLHLMEADNVVEEVTLKAEVVRKAEDGFAVEFKEIPLQDFIILKRIVALNESDEA